ncbi:hypothetical protein [Massilia sp. TWR1-2-2]|uniref:hypothetical protein n=1 Tax=Massilia sp. TWR1-2-2 TaxID=2804584 RepID=UPI003CF62F90
MKKIATSLALFLASQLACAQTVYNGYDAYYLSRKGIFRNASPLRIDGSRNAVVHWQNQRIELKRSKPFRGEFTVNDDIGSHAISFVNFPYACIEGKSSSASGTAVRHTSVYLLDAKEGGRVKAYKLPSLFAACSEVRLDRHGRPLFFDADYVYEKGSESAVGVILREYVLNNREFVSTGHSVKTHFVEPENVWKFEVATEQ